MACAKNSSSKASCAKTSSWYNAKNRLLAILYRRQVNVLAGRGIAWLMPCGACSSSAMPRFSNHLPLGQRRAKHHQLTTTIPNRIINSIVQIQRPARLEHLISEILLRSDSRRMSKSCDSFSASHRRPQGCFKYGASNPPASFQFHFA